jgi:hypothetical protein
MKLAHQAPLWIGLIALLALSACGDDEEPPTTDPCGNRCISGFEVCNAATGQCEPIGGGDTGPDAGDAGDVGDAADQADADDGRDEGGTGRCTAETVEDDCEADEYCDESMGTGLCVRGCRVDPDSCADCDAFPDTCDDGLSCHPTTHRCVEGCTRDDDCLDADDYCDIDTLSCEPGCRLEPDNCPDFPDVDVRCDFTSRRCVDGACAVDAQCPDAFFCDGSRCVIGCRTSPDTCGSGQVCDEATHLCEERACVCEATDSDETCDAQCDDESGGTAFYCDRERQVCLFGCRILDDGTDTCRVGTICDPSEHTCQPGCRAEPSDNCPFGSYCDTSGDSPSCAPGCKEGECDDSQYCDLDTRACRSESCSVDGDCPDGTYCGAGFCLDGCRTDDPATGDVDEDTCPIDRVCDAGSHRCVVPSCIDDQDCDLGEICNDVGRCEPGCDPGADPAHCPPGQPCSTQTLLCGCLGDGDCPVGTHCVTPVCENDCTADDPLTTPDEDDCPAGQSCDPASGRCVSGCVDTSEPAGRNDNPDTATCILFDEADLTDANVLFLCKHGEDYSELDFYCDDEAGTFCLDATGCSGGDFDWYSTYLYAGDRIWFYADYANPDATNFTLSLSSAAAPGTPIRYATRTETGLGTATPVDIAQSGQYFLRAFAVASVPVAYSLEVVVDRTFVCRPDLEEPNDRPGTAVPLSTLEASSFTNLSICAGDQDFFEIALYVGNQLEATLNPAEDDVALSFAIGEPDCPVSGCELAQDILESGPRYSVGLFDTETADPNDLIISRTIGATDVYYLRAQESLAGGTSAYTLAVTPLQGAATCLSDIYEDNDTPGAVGDAGRWDNPSLPGDTSFPGARLCPTDVDVFAIDIDSHPNGFLTASLNPVSERLRLEILDSSENPLPAEDVIGDPNDFLTTRNRLPSGLVYVRVSHDAAGGTIPYYGEAYELTIEYRGSQCTDDHYDPNNDELEEAALVHPTTLLVAADTGCGSFDASPISSTCDGAGAVYCNCENEPNLTLCPADDDWYQIRLLQGDTFSIAITTGADARFDVLPTLWDPDGDMVDDFFAYTTNGLVLRDVQAEAPAGTVVADYWLEIVPLGAEPIDYEVLVEVAGEHSRHCRGDLWDADFADYPNENEVHCTEGSGCSLQLGAGDADQRSGQLCFWDDQDWFRFDVSSTADRLVTVQFDDLGGRVEADLYREVGGTPSDLIGPLESRAGLGTPPGVDWVFRDLAAGTYQLRVGRVGDSLPNDYTVYLDGTNCNDTRESNNEDCEPSVGATCDSGTCNTSRCLCE